MSSSSQAAPQYRQSHASAAPIGPCSPRDAESADQVEWLPLAFNTKWNGRQHGSTLKECHATTHDEERRREWQRRVAALPAILHFHGPTKPWSKLINGITTAGRVWHRWCERSDCVPDKV